VYGFDLRKPVTDHVRPLVEVVPFVAVESEEEVEEVEEVEVIDPGCVVGLSWWIGSICISSICFMVCWRMKRV